jgi:predicted metal-dependent phosphoesterase TrpH
MPKGAPFTALCQEASRHVRARVDLHLHTTCSDGAYTPAQIVDLARRSGLPALAITDHDSCAGVLPARQAAGDALEVICGVEITAEYRGHELHLLGYFLNPDDPDLAAALEWLRIERVARFHAMIDSLRRLGITLPPFDEEPQAISPALGRRHLAHLLVKARRVSTIQQAFQRYLGDHGPVQVPKKKLPVAEAIARVRAAGGVAAWAHPNYDCTEETLIELKELGLGAVEVEYPSCRPGRRRELRQWTRQLGLAITGGSDCHGPDIPSRTVGMCGIDVRELELLRSCCR